MAPEYNPFIYWNEIYTTTKVSCLPSFTLVLAKLIIQDDSQEASTQNCARASVYTSKKGAVSKQKRGEKRWFSRPKHAAPMTKLTVRHWQSLWDPVYLRERMIIMLMGSFCILRIMSVVIIDTSAAPVFLPRFNYGNPLLFSTFVEWGKGKQISGRRTLMLREGFEPRT